MRQYILTISLLTLTLTYEINLTLNLTDYYQPGILPTLLCQNLTIPIINTTTKLPRFQTIISFGDSYSDTDNVNKLSFGLLPDKNYYCNGRFTNGLVWTEYLKKMLDNHYNNNNNIELINFAYGGAISNAKLNNYNELVPSLDDQVTLFINYYKSNYKKQTNFTFTSFQPTKTMNETLITFYLAGNDYSLPNITPNQVVNELKFTLKKLIQSTNINYLLLVLMAPLESAPRNALNPNLEFQLKQSQKWKLHNKLLLSIIPELNQLSNNLTIIPYDISKVWIPLLTNSPIDSFNYSNTSINQWNSKYPCLISNNINSTQDNLFNSKSQCCKISTNYFFWDTIHPTTIIHRELAKGAFTTLTNWFKD